MISAPLIEYLKKGVFTLLGLVLAVYLFVILTTYTGNDPSWSHISSDMTTINNVGGASGAWLSDLLYSFFGIGAWWLLAFLLYESILIWWDNQPTFWLMRLTAYVFLLLSASALAAQWVALAQPVVDPAATKLEEMAGGIIGLELQSRLAQILSQWGSAVFLAVFVVVTTTFAFNVHWLVIYRKFVSLSWLGSGVKYQDRTPEDLMTPADTLSLHEDDALIESDNAEERLAPEQLPLELLSKDREKSVGNSGRFGHVLSDFLATSGVSESVKASMNKASMNKASVSQAAQMTAPRVSASSVSARADNTQSQPATPAPSDTVIGASSKPDQSPVTDLPTADVDEALLNIASDETAASDEVLADTPQPSPSTPVSGVFDALAPVAAAVPSAIASSGAQSPVAQEQTMAQLPETLVPEIPVDIAPKPLLDTSVAAADERALFTDTDASPQDKWVSDAQDSTAPISPDQTSSVPTVRFAVPEGDSSNHIADMMPDHDLPEPVIPEPVMPDISDDAAFSQKSRSMQTAAYRSSLTPIPALSILDKPDPNRKPSYTIAELEQLSELLEIKLQEFNVKAAVVNAIPGPVVTRFEVELAAGVKASKVTGISRDLARSLSMASLRVVEVIPGKPYIGIEVPNKKREMVRLIELLNTETFQDPNAQISMAMGKDIGGNPIITDLARAPHMLVAGTTGSGKSVLVNSMLLSMLLKYTPDELRLILIDPKQLELANYNDIPHLLTPVVTDMTEAASALSWCVAEMERRYQLMSLLKVRKLNEFNKKVVAAEASGTPMLDPLWRPNDSVSITQAPKLKTLPMIVIVADEFADMIMQVGKQAEELITRLAQKSRAAGIHLMLATQRPSVDVITGLIKANIPVRAALRVNSKVDSRTILDSGGAEDMLGNGDMLFLGPGQIEPDRVHGAYVSDEEVNRVCDAWRERGAPNYIDNMAGDFELSGSGSGGGTANASGEDDDLYNDAVAFVIETRKVSASSIQRKFSIGYNRAARIVDSMEEAGLVSSMGKSGKRELLM